MKRGYTHSVEARMKMSQTRKGRPSPFKGHSHTEATKQKIRENSLGHVQTLERRQATSKWFKAWWATLDMEERRKRTAKARAKVPVPVSAETRERMRKASKDRPLNRGLRVQFARMHIVEEEVEECSRINERAKRLAVAVVYEKKTLQQAGEQWGISKQRVSQIVKTVLHAVLCKRRLRGSGKSLS